MNRKISAAFLIVALLAPTVIYPITLMRVLSYGLFASSFNLLIGYTGLLSFGHAVFFGSSAYITGLAIKAWGLPTLLAIFLGAISAALLGLGMGYLAIRRQGIYFSMITLALAQMVYFIVLQTPATGGEDGLQGISRGSLFGLVDLNQSWSMYLFVLGVFCLSMLALHRVLHSPFGVALSAIRQNEARAVSLGFEAERFKLMAFVLSAFLSGLAGAMNCLVFQLASLSDVSWHLSGEVILMTLLGGMGTFVGPLAGATLVIGLETFLRASVGSWVQVIIGGAFVLCVLAFRRGVIGELSAALKIKL